MRGELNLLVDTHILLWTLNEPSRLSQACREALEMSDNQVWVSSISLWEIWTKEKLGKLKVPPGIVPAIASQQMQILKFSAEHAFAAANLPLHHRDPFDRALLAQASVEKLRFVTADKALRLYEPKISLLFMV